MVSLGEDLSNTGLLLGKGCLWECLPNYILQGIEQHFKIYIYIYIHTYINNLICLFMAVIALHCCVGITLVGANGGSSLVVVLRLLLLQSKDSRAHRLQ